MVSLVEQMLSLHRRKAEEKTPHETEPLERQIEATDRAIDALVYELYGLTEEEIKIVEGEAVGTRIRRIQGWAGLRAAQSCGNFVIRVFVDGLPE
jgi:hypothetical protein